MNLINSNSRIKLKKGKNKNKENTAKQKKYWLLLNYCVLNGNTEKGREEKNNKNLSNKTKLPIRHSL